MAEDDRSGLEVRRVPWVEDDLKRNGVTEEALGRFCWALRFVRWSNPSRTLEELFAVVSREVGGVVFYEAQLPHDKGSSVFLFFAVGALNGTESAVLFGCAGASAMRGRARAVTLELMAIRAAGVIRHFAKRTEQ